MYFTVSVKVSYTDDKGKVKKSVERYLVDALSVTEAEARTAEFMKTDVRDSEIVAVNQSRILEVISPKETPDVYGK
tara:strand:- start:1953 stop:2180 length:228 start_codon:yes stop_codon:yes gene_type:complete